MRPIFRRWLTAGTLIAALILIVGSFALAQAPRTSATVTRIAIAATPIDAFDNRDPTRIRFGALEFRGGLVLTSDYRAFGGISAKKSRDSLQGHIPIILGTKKGTKRNKKQKPTFSNIEQ